MALVLTRRAGEAIRIGDDCLVRVRCASGNRVILEVDAPAKVRVMRTELLQDEQAKGEARRRQAASRDAAGS